MPATNIAKIMIAPCGMNCGICMGHLREQKKCLGCNSPDENKPKHCTVCRIKHCSELNKQSGNYCYTCHKYPCTRLKQLDQRYRTKYGMSMIDNLNSIKEFGIEAFMVVENERWVCERCGKVVCVHNKKCYNCGSPTK